MKKAIGYVRVSTEGQKDDFGIEAQKEMISSFALKNDYEIIEFKVEVMSGAKDDDYRPVFNSLITDDLGVDTIIVAKSDRVARDTKLYFYYLYCLEKKGITLISAKELFDDPSIANIYRSLILFVAEQELKNITMRTSAGRSVKASKGGYSGGRVPYGYSASNGGLIINEDEAQIVRFVFERWYKGGTLNGIAVQLIESGITKRNGTLNWNAMAIKHIVENEPFFYGYYKYGDMEWVKGQQPPLFDDKTFNLEKWLKKKSQKNKKA